jgi:hypothetical protein
MKKNIAIILICLLASISIVQAQDSKAENLGLVSELVFIKLTSENLAIRIVNDTLIKEEDKIKFANLYNDVKVISDQVILQLMTDSRRKNSLRYFKKIDNLLVNKNINQIEESDLSKMKLKGYIKNLKKINSVYNKLMAFKTSDKPNENPLLNMSLKGFFPATMSVEELTGVLSFVTATIKDIRESKEKKVEKITSILNEVRLTSLQDLAKGKTKEPEKKEEKK